MLRLQQFVIFKRIFIKLIPLLLLLLFTLFYHFLITCWQVVLNVNLRDREPQVTIKFFPTVD